MRFMIGLLIAVSAFGQFPSTPSQWKRTGPNTIAPSRAGDSVVVGNTIPAGAPVSSLAAGGALYSAGLLVDGTGPLLAGIVLHGVKPGIVFCADTMTEPKCGTWWMEANGNFNFNTENSDGTNPQALFQYTRSTGTWDSMVPFNASAFAATSVSGTGYDIHVTGQAADEKYWSLLVGGKTLSWRTLNDIGGGAVEFMNVVRGTGTALTSMTLGGTNGVPVGFGGGILANTEVRFNTASSEDGFIINNKNSSGFGGSLKIKINPSGGEKTAFQLSAVSDGTGGLVSFLVNTTSTNVATFLSVDHTRAATFTGVVKAAGYQSSDGTAGFTGSCAPTTTITVKNGLITGCS